MVPVFGVIRFPGFISVYEYHYYCLHTYYINWMLTKWSSFRSHFFIYYICSNGAIMYVIIYSRNLIVEISNFYLKIRTSGEGGWFAKSGQTRTRGGRVVWKSGFYADVRSRWALCWLYNSCTVYSPLWYLFNSEMQLSYPLTCLGGVATRIRSNWV